MKHRDIWAAVRRHLHSAPRTVRRVKVKAHTTEEDLAAGRYGIAEHTRAGNKLADTEAGDAATLAAAPRIETREVQLQDTLGFLLLRRLTTINMHCAKLDVYKYEQRVDRNPRIRNTVCLTEHFRATEHTI